MNQLWIVAVLSLVFCSVNAQNNTNGTLECGNRGCCPEIVCKCGGPGTAISPDSGCRGMVAVIVDWGTCTVNDVNFKWRIDWGDGKVDYGYQDHLGPYMGPSHQYPECDKYYFVTISYQHLGSGCYCPCGDTAYGHIRTMRGKPPDPPLPTCYHR